MVSCVAYYYWTRHTGAIYNKKGLYKSLNKKKIDFQDLLQRPHLKSDIIKICDKKYSASGFVFIRTLYFRILKKILSKKHRQFVVKWLFAGWESAVGIQENSWRIFSKISDRKWTFEISVTVFLQKDTKIRDKKETFEI